jgi:hypothetical protein
VERADWLISDVCFSEVLLINTGVGDRLVNDRTRDLLLEEPDNAGYVPPVRVGQAVKWSGEPIKLYRLN